MKKLVLLMTFTLSSPLFARQYFQCNVADVNSSDVAVINLTTPKKGTLFLSSGMENSETDRLVVQLTFDKIQKKNHVYKIVNERGAGSVTIPSSVIGKSSDLVRIDLDFANYSFSYDCFSRIYEE